MGSMKPDAPFLAALARPGIQDAVRRLASEIRSLPGFAFDEISFSERAGAMRMLFSVLRAKDRPGRLKASLRSFLILSGFDAWIGAVEGVSALLSKELALIRHPAHIVGVSWRGGEAIEGKVYWRTAEWGEELAEPDGTGAEGGWIMYETDAERAWRAISGAMDVLGMQGRKEKAEEVLRSMYGDGFGVELVGVDLSKDRDPELKLYFQPLGTPKPADG